MCLADDSCRTVDAGKDFDAALKRPSLVRHRWEMPMIWLSAAITLVVLGFAVLTLLVDIPEDLRAAIEGEDGLDPRAILAFAVVAPFLYGFIRFFMAAGVRANSIKVGPTQFPEIHARYLILAERIGVRHLPALYVVNGNGVVNAYAFSCNRRTGYVVLHAEIAQLIHYAPQIVDFVLAHELAHIRLGHVSLWRQLIGTIPNLFYLPGQAATRAQEYSADRMALCVCPGTGDAASLLAVGPVMASDVNPDAWLEQCRDEDRSWLVRLHNILSSHAVLTKRYSALKEVEVHGLSRHGQMF